MKKITLALAIIALTPMFAFGAATTTPEGAMPWCSGPMAPGWNVSLPNGGCSDVQAEVSLGGMNPIQTEIVTLQIKLVELLKQLITLLSR